MIIFHFCFKFLSKTSLFCNSGGENTCIQKYRVLFIWLLKLCNFFFDKNENSVLHFYLKFCLEMKQCIAMNKQTFIGFHINPCVVSIPRRVDSHVSFEDESVVIGPASVVNAVSCLRLKHLLVKSREALHSLFMSML